MEQISLNFVFHSDMMDYYFPFIYSHDNEEISYAHSFIIHSLLKGINISIEE